MIFRYLTARPALVNKITASPRGLRNLERSQNTLESLQDLLRLVPAILSSSMSGLYAQFYFCAYRLSLVAPTFSCLQIYRIEDARVDIRDTLKATSLDLLVSSALLRVCFRSHAILSYLDA